MLFGLGIGVNHVYLFFDGCQSVYYFDCHLHSGRSPSEKPWLSIVAFDLFGLIFLFDVSVVVLFDCL